ncbi:circularly permuted type 2 ATP-grasp protein [Cereibacter sphaeroides]|uniref:circularly permuted type 2 ATP-grasp protein n=1 Tax=Cereibacter sphaeroides TaxID=1063 RepID=UPI001F3BA071|nr:circularly permuted type 2 ATP-grasp protein [Cereibacter sphaeroides]MCE6958932.1 circularly permuted type 2 ATP-grasp protein [Cereibacter sphaeroides]MCE6973570.1 circularly permuted type 2 ATP-grasp protein [Cereibacter sphaeroides]
MDRRHRPAPGLPGLIEGYVPQRGVPDELLDAAGEIRPVWRNFIRHVAGLAPDELHRRFARGDQYLRDAGVFFRQYSAEGSDERAWPLSHIPVLLEEAEWRTLGEGLIQRAELMEALMADLYGPNRLVAEGVLPPALVAGNPEWLRPMVGLAPRGGHHLHFLAFEVGRGPDGDWWVLGDRAQAPSGAGFALENRVATSRVFSDFYAEAHVHRLAGFFRTFRNALQELQADPKGRVGILTPGPLNETYYEHAWIARYLGFMLLQGEDLTVDAGRLMVRTVAGPQPVSVLWRRLDSLYADPLELAGSSRLGTPGLVSALRHGSTTLVNNLGSGVLETRAFLAFMPRIARALLGEELRLPNIATWWCGQAAERAHVAAHAERMVISPALSTRQPIEDELSALADSQLPPKDLAGWLEREGAGLVGQESVGLSTTPALIDGQLLPRPMSLRVFLARTPSGWQVMPGGFARIGRTPDAKAIALQRGGAAADVWIVSPAPVDAASLIPTRGRELQAREGALPSRAADNLFWLGRYVERTEGTMRLLRAHNVRLAETGDPRAPLLATLAPLFRGQGIDPEEGIPQGLIRTLRSAVASAGQVRDRFSPDGWSALADLDKTMRRMAERVSPGDDAARALSALLRKVTGFSGLVHENMYRVTGWRFLELGRHIERAAGMAATLATLADPWAPEGGLDLAVEAGDSVMTHRRRFAVTTSRETVVDLLALDAMNPRSILFQLDGIEEQVRFLPGATASPMPDLMRLVLRTRTNLCTERAEFLDTDALWRLRSAVWEISDLITETYLR